MNILQFIASIVGSVVWPVVVLIIILIFRPPLSQIILSLKNLTYKDWQINFDKEVAKLESAADQAKLPNLLLTRGDNEQQQNKIGAEELNKQIGEEIETKLKDLMNQSRPEWDKKIQEEVQSLIEYLQKTLESSITRKDDFDEKIEKLARIDPRSAIIEATYQLEQAIDAATGRLGLTPSRTGLYKDVNILLNNNYIDVETAKIWHDMRDLRNKAAHSPEINITCDAAIEYAQLAKRMIQKFASLHK